MEVIIEILGGVPHVQKKDKGFKLQIIDHDNNPVTNEVYEVNDIVTREINK